MYVKGKSAKMQDKKELIGKLLYIANGSINKDSELIGVVATSKQFADKVIGELVSQEYTKSAKIVVEEARKYLSKKPLDNLMDLDNKLQEFEILLADLFERLCLRDYEEQISKLQELRVFSKGLEAQSIRSFLEQVLVSIGNYVTEAELSNSNEALEKLQVSLELSFKEMLNN